MFKECFVPNCNNNTINAFHKIYLYVPMDSPRRRKWFDAINCSQNRIYKNRLYCCEDHFVLEEDAENWMYYKTIGSRQIILKKHVVPHKNIAIRISPTEKSQLTPSAKKRKANILEKLKESRPSCSNKKLFIEELSTSEALNTPTKQLDHDSVKSPSRKSWFYLGVKQECYYLIKLLSNEIKCPYVNILITLKKIRLNDQFIRLGHDFSLTEGDIREIFISTVPKMAGLLKHIIGWPDRADILLSLPVQFRVQFKNVQSVIDCFEIQIEQPSNSLHRSMTWSKYKKQNTMKYLISAIPNGFINFISPGYGGRISDVTVVENCGYLDVLPQNAMLLADRKFKELTSILATTQCKLLRSPSIASNLQLQKSAAKESERIAFLAPIERVIDRLREFHMIKQHAYVNKDLVYLLDYIVIIVCGLVNLQGLLIK